MKAVPSTRNISVMPLDHDDKDHAGLGDAYRPSAALVRGCQVVMETPPEELVLSNVLMADEDAQALLDAMERGEY